MYELSCGRCRWHVQVVQFGPVWALKKDANGLWQRYNKINLTCLTHVTNYKDETEELTVGSGIVHDFIRKTAAATFHPANR
jgi:hypothetical protein